MINTPLEKYAEAFQLQQNGRIEEAERLYREIAHRHPGTPEAGYAVVQLEKIAADRVILQTPEQEVEEEEIKVVKVTKSPYGRGKVVRRFTAVSVTALALSITAIICFVALFFYVSSQTKRHIYQETLCRALSASVNGDERSFLRAVADAKVSAPEENLPYFIIVDYYLKNNRKDAALKELRDCPQFDSDYKAYVERVRDFKPAPMRP